MGLKTKMIIIVQDKKNYLLENTILNGSLRMILNLKKQ